ncbi:MAG TPA: 2'-5' RNA ligase family protein [Sunxiuqinia sp.]|nr:2'-5' RNA ligase family protein [Sunxiuqinia sp.]
MPINLPDHYDLLYRNAVQKIKSGQYQADSLIDSLDDHRMGVTLLLRPSPKVNNNIQQFLYELKAIDPTQYYYPNSDMHITVLSIISCYSGFKLSQIDVDEYVEVIRQSIPRQPILEISFSGITASPSCVMIQGFPIDGSLNEIRNRLRTNFQQTNLMQSIDQRYQLQTAHSTVARFRTELKQKSKFIAVMDRYRDFDFGTFRVDALELVYNDWYQRQERVQRLHRFDLG